MLLCVFEYVCVLGCVRVVMAMTVLQEAPGLFLCDCPQQEVMSPVFLYLLLTQETEQRDMSLSGKRSISASLPYISVQVINII